MSELLTPPLRLNPDAPQRKLISAACTVLSIPFSRSSVPERAEGRGTSRPVYVGPQFPQKAAAESEGQDTLQHLAAPSNYIHKSYEQTW